MTVHVLNTSMVDVTAGHDDLHVRIYHSDMLEALLPVLPLGSPDEWRDVFADELHAGALAEVEVEISDRATANLLALALDQIAGFQNAARRLREGPPGRDVDCDHCGGLGTVQSSAPGWKR